MSEIIKAKIISSKLIDYFPMYEQEMIMYPDYLYNFIKNNQILWDNGVCEVICENIKPNSDFLDIGANYGLVSLGVKKILEKTGRMSELNSIHLVECNNDLLDCLQFNLITNNKEKTNTYLYPFALSSEYEICNICVNPYNQGCNFIKNIYDCKNETLTTVSNNYENDFNTTNNNLCIPSMPLDSILGFFKNEVSVVKIDVEGMEYKVLKGATKFLQKFKPVLIIELWDEKFEESNKLLEGEGYYIEKIIRDELSTTKDYVYKHKDKN